MNGKPKTIWLAGGGTGGHISPAISIYENLIVHGHHPLLITLEKNKEYPPIVNLDKKNKRVIFYRASPIPKSIKSLNLFIKDIKFSLNLLTMESRIKYPDAVLAFGGYPVFPVLVWSFFHKIPFYLHEQNERHGVITRLFSLKARKVFVSFPKKKYAVNEILTGNPLRKIFVNYKTVSAKGKVTDKTLKRKKTVRNILLLGGSQGANDINDLYIEMSKSTFFKNDAFTISTGKTDFERIQSQAKNLKRKKDRLYSFIDDVPLAMLTSDIIISRSGSGMIFEILWSGKPACFIPYPHAASDHQKYNSLALSGLGPYKTIDLRPFDPKGAMSKIIEFMSHIDENAQQQSITRENLSDKIPLNAHEIITNILLGDLQQITQGKNEPGPV